MATDTGTDHGSTIIRALEGAWDAIRRHHPDLPGVVMVTGHGRTPGDDAVTWGHHWPGRWTAADGSAVRPELFAGGELLALGSRRIMQTLLHEAAHALATVRGIKDTSTGGRYHNREFAKLASALGLQPQPAPTSSGAASATARSPTRPSPGTRRRSRRSTRRSATGSRTRSRV
ncbi:hypothetical protein ACFQ1I_46500 [Kitasatospora arboriphila]